MRPLRHLTLRVLGVTPLIQIQILSHQIIRANKQIAFAVFVGVYVSLEVFEDEIVELHMVLGMCILLVICEYKKF